MMCFVFRFAVVVLFLSTLCPVAAEDIKPAVDNLIRPLIDEKRTVGVVVGILNGEETRVFGYGRMVKEFDRAPNGDTVFEIGSITKVFTATILADMVLKGEVKLEDPVRLYVPEDARIPTSGTREITLLDLATHRSGLPRMPANFHLSELRNRANPYKNYDADMMFRFLSVFQLPRGIDERYEYSNLGYALLGYALTRKAGKSYEELVLERVCRPLGLGDTTQTFSPGRKARLARGYTQDLKATLNWDLEAFAAAGGLRSTTNDMLRFMKANLGLTETKLGPALEMAQKPRRPAQSRWTRMGLGWHISLLHGTEYNVINHNGGTGGYHSYLGFVKETKTGVVILANSPWYTDPVALQVLRLLDSGQE